MTNPPKSVEIAFSIAESGSPAQPTKQETLAVGHESEIPEGGRKIVAHGGIEIGVFRSNGAFYALRNYCPHQGAPLCRGTVDATHAPAPVGEFRPALAGRVLRCPWHGWEFDLATGKGLYDAKGRVKTYAVRVDDGGNIFLDL